MIKNFQEIVSQIKEHIPVHELISEYLSLKKSGSGYVALCPFHDDHKPSMHINSSKGIFKCFSCGTGGDIIYFYSQINKKKFYESVVDLANKYGFKIEYGDENKTEIQIKDNLFALNRDALDFFKHNLFLEKNKHALNYLCEQRGYSCETLKKFEIGFAPASWDLLLKHMSLEKKYSNDLIIASGLFIPKENSDNYYDRFRNRIIIPIFNEAGQVIAFGGRTISDEEPKYLNSPETLIFSKGNCLFGLNFAKEEIKKSDFVILTEGYFDVITAHMRGLLNTVAVLGTAFTNKQAKLLAKHTESKKVYLCLDSDQAGLKAVESVFRVINDKQFPVFLDAFVVSDLGKKDLDEALQEKDESGIKEKINKATKLINFILDRISTNYITTDGSAAKKIIFDEALEILSNINDLMEQKSCINYLSHKLNIEEELLILKLKDKSRKNQRFKKGEQKTRNTEENLHTMYSSERFKHAEIELLALYICSFPHNFKSIKAELAGLEFIDEKHKLIKEYLDNLPGENLQMEQVLNSLMIEFNEYKHIMAVISDIAWRIHSDEANVYTKSENKILLEAKEWINWWIRNKQQLKTLTDKLKDCKDDDESSKILSQMVQIVRGETKN